MTHFEQMAALGEYREAAESAMQRLAEHNIADRNGAKDYTLRSDSPTEITNRLGWLIEPLTMMQQTNRLIALRESLLKDGIQNAVVLGMGGSSLAPELYAKVFGKQARGLNVVVVDSTDPSAVRR